MTRKDAIEAMRLHNRFAGETPKWLPIFTLPGVEGFQPFGNTWSGEVALFLSFPMTSWDEDSPWCKALDEASKATMSAVSIYPIREVENFIPLAYGHQAMHDHIRRERVMFTPYAAKASPVSQAELGFALHALGCKPPLTFGCVDRRTWTLGFECDPHDYAVLRLAPAFTRQRVNELMVEARQGDQTLASWSMGQANGKAMAEARSVYFERQRLRNPKDVAA